MTPRRSSAVSSRSSTRSGAQQKDAAWRIVFKRWRVTAAFMRLSARVRGRSPVSAGLAAEGVDGRVDGREQVARVERPDQLVVGRRTSSVDRASHPGPIHHPNRVNWSAVMACQSAFGHANDVIGGAAVTTGRQAVDAFADQHHGEHEQQQHCDDCFVVREPFPLAAEDRLGAVAHREVHRDGGEHAAQAEHDVDDQDTDLLARLGCWPGRPIGRSRPTSLHASPTTSVAAPLVGDAAARL